MLFRFVFLGIMAELDRMRGVVNEILSLLLELPSLSDEVMNCLFCCEFRGDRKAIVQAEAIEHLHWCQAGGRVHGII